MPSFLLSSSIGYRSNEGEKERRKAADDINKHLLLCSPHAPVMRHGIHRFFATHIPLQNGQEMQALPSVLVLFMFFVWQIVHPSMQMVAKDFLFACCIPPAQ